MTEAEWLSSEDWFAMTCGSIVTRYVGRFSERVCRLFTAACVRRVWDHLVRDESRSAIELSERAADHPVPARELAFAVDLADEAAVAVDRLCLSEEDPRIWAAYAASIGSRLGPNIDSVAEVWCYCETGGGKKDVADLYRDIIGNPFRPCSLEPGWVTATVSSLARGACDRRSLPSGHLDSASLAILADALEEAGCNDASILDHCRGLGPHVRGCWVLDLILGRS